MYTKKNQNNISKRNTRVIPKNSQKIQKNESFLTHLKQSEGEVFFGV